MKSYDTYIFDLDGTLTNTMSMWLDVFRLVLKKFDIYVPDDKTLASHTHNWSEMTKLGLPEDKLEKFKTLIHGNLERNYLKQSCILEPMRCLKS